MELVTGSEALALGAWDAGVRVAAGYPGAPVTGAMAALQTLAERHPGECDARWLANERIALDLTIGAALSGRRALCVMKSVGFNTIIDELQLVNLTGVDGGLVLLLGDDLQALGSQNNQDSRLLVRAVELPLIEPADPADGYRTMLDAFDLSGQLALPVVVHIVEEFAGMRAPLPQRRQRTDAPAPAAPIDMRRRLSAPPLVAGKHRALHGALHTAATVLNTWPGNSITGAGALGVITVGICGSKYETLSAEMIDATRLRRLQLAVSFPLPEDLIVEFFEDITTALILEAGEPFVEEQLRALLQRRGMPALLYGRQTGHVSDDLHVTEAALYQAVRQSFPGVCRSVDGPPAPDAPVRLSEFPFEAGCPFAGVFQAFRRSVSRLNGPTLWIVGEPGCNVRLRLPPYDLFDYRAAMGSGTGLAAGVALCQEPRRTVAVIGDSAFLHSGLTPLADAVQQGWRALILIMDNGVLGVTGCQAGPTAGAHPVDLEDLCRACGVTHVQTVATEDARRLEEIFSAALTAQDLRVLILSFPCRRCVDVLKRS